MSSTFELTVEDSVFEGCSAVSSDTETLAAYQCQGCCTESDDNPQNQGGACPDSFRRYGLGGGGILNFGRTTVRRSVFRRNSAAVPVRG